MLDGVDAALSPPSPPRCARGGVCLEQSADLLDYDRGAQQGIIVGHAQDANAALAEECVAKSITSLAAGV